MADIIVIGGGAAGLIAAGKAAGNGADVLVLEKRERPARKLMITGKGRCNVTNACTLLDDIMAQIPGNGRFLYGALSRFMPSDTMDFFENLGVPLKIERGNRVFPESDSAVDIVDALCGYVKQSGAKIKTGVSAGGIITDNGAVTGVRDTAGSVYPCKSVILATGGLSYPATGSTGDGYGFAAECGHGIVEPKPSLVPLVLAGGDYARMQGLSLRNVAITVRDKNTYREVYDDFGELLFTHFGVSGPVILSASAHLRDITPGKYELTIDLKPALGEQKLDERLIRDFAKFPNKGLANALAELLPHKMIPVIVERSGIAPDIKANKITRDMRHDLGYLLKNLTFDIVGVRPVEEAIITAGGVKTSEINPRTMESKLVKGLYFAGEVIDVDAYTGGFNLQIAFSTGVLAGLSASSDK